MNEHPQQPWVDVNEIKRAISIDQVLAHYGLLDKLQRRGNNLSGLSPFRQETRPSFFVSLEKGAWNDYPRPTVEGKAVPGNVVGLVMAIENCGFREALLKLHALAGMAPAPARPPLVAAVSVGTRAKVDAVVAGDPPAGGPPANEAFGKELAGLRFDVPFLAERGLPAERARWWRVGYCSRGLMKGRVVIPIRNRAGELVAYIGRSLKDDDEAGKWKFPLGFRKSLELFGVDRLANDQETKEAVAKYGLILVEGAFDAIALIEKGFKNTVSTLGSDVSVQQRELLVSELNPTKRVTIFFDDDPPGREARKKLAADLIHQAFVRYADVRRVDAGGRTDPDEFDHGELLAILSGQPKEP